MTLQEHAIAIARVSTVHQREEDQTPGLVTYAQGRAYVLDAIIPINGKSAFHGKHLKHVLAAIDQYVRKGEATVVIFRDVDRSSRQGAQATFDLRGEIIRAGGRMEFSGQEYLNDQRTQEMLLGLLATAAREESETKSRRTLQGNAASAQRGEVTGKPAWGYQFGTVDGKRVLVPTDLGREWIPRIYTLCAEGKSLRYLRDLLSESGVPSPGKATAWSISTLTRLIASPTYKGDRRGKGNLEYETLVTAELWAQANLALKSRVIRGRSTVKSEPVLLKPYCGACWGVLRDGAALNVKQPDGTVKLTPTGRSPMYRRVKLYKGKRYTYYGCCGHGPANRTCGAPGIPEAVLDQAVDEIMAADQRPHFVLEFIPGDDKAEKLAKINDAIALAGHSSDYSKVAELAAEAEQIRQEPHRRGRTERRATGMTVGEHWQGLNLTEKREELMKWTVVAWPDKVRVLGQWHDSGTTVGAIIRGAEDGGGLEDEGT
jgi:DNA invertase Pin-like site-specific DNA recombinase